jgi:hypothetical protein
MTRTGSQHNSLICQSQASQKGQSRAKLWPAAYFASRNAYGSSRPSHWRMLSGDAMPYGSQHLLVRADWKPDVVCYELRPYLAWSHWRHWYQALA